jgi:hypothetical protein
MRECERKPRQMTAGFSHRNDRIGVAAGTNALDAAQVSIPKLQLSLSSSIR